MRIKHGLPLSPLSSGRKGSGAARERLGDEHEWGDRGGQGVTVALLAVGTCHARPLGAAELAAHGSLVSLNKGGKARKAAKEGEARRGERGSEAMSRGGARRSLPGLGSSPGHTEKPPPWSHRGYSDVVCGEHPLWKRTVLFT